MPQTSQSWLAERGGGSADAADEDALAGGAAAEEEGDDELVLEGGSADVADQEAGADADAAGEGGGWGDNGDVEVDGPVAALGGFPPFFFVMAWCVGVLEA